jgi:hypothetical protein
VSLPPSDDRRSARPGVRPEESLAQGGIKGVALVTLATAVLAGGALLIALVVGLLY